MADLSKRQIAKFTRVWFLDHVVPSVLHQLTVVSERLVANITWVWLYDCVCSPMLSQMTNLSEWHVANVACEQFIAFTRIRATRKIARFGVVHAVSNDVTRIFSASAK